MKISHLFIFPAFVFIIACNTTRKTSPRASKEPVITIDSAITIEAKRPEYHPSRKRTIELLHTSLDVRFDWKEKQLEGKATLTITPYFYPIDSVFLDAKKMNFHEIALVADGNTSPLKYSYADSSTVRIKLDKTYSKGENIKLFFRYTANPERIENKGSAAINEAKGLYFINADGKEEDKPRQIWSQGETESNSVWFPTVDSPNERMTQEIYLTVDTSFVTLSNGLLEYSRDNGDGTRTDYWKQNLPAAPYLTMIAVGKFSVIKDKWRGIEVNYYVEPEYARYAEMIFGRTPEMLEFYSKKLGVDYPWEKFSQIVVRDYISGAMENTTAVVHGEFIQRNDREYLDQTNEDVISHELFHHWFGDLVTCESWSNLPLNESFATYGEYLWNEYKYGKDAADYGWQSDMNAYIQQSKNKQHDLIWYYYDDKEDMFDGISYQKGSCILHMLRNYIGDDAFFASLKKYLTENKFKSVEAVNLRLAFEEVTGEDLNWFFNQWFFGQGHPDLIVNTTYSDSSKKVILNVKQEKALLSDGKDFKAFRLPVAVDVYVNGKKERHNIVVNKANEEFTFTVPSRPDLVNFDAEKILVATVKQNKPVKEWAFQYRNAPKYMDRFDAISNLADQTEKDTIVQNVLFEALSDKFWAIRSHAVKALNKENIDAGQRIRDKLKTMALKDSKSQVRAAAIKQLTKLYSDTSLAEVYKEALEDPSYLVMGSALQAIAKLFPEKALDLAKNYEKEKNKSINVTITDIYSEMGKDEQHPFFERVLEKSQGVDKYLILQNYGKFLSRTKNDTISEGIDNIEKAAKETTVWWIHFAATQSLTDVLNGLTSRERELQDKLEQYKKESWSEAEIQHVQKELTNTKQLKEKAVKKIEEIRSMDKDKNF